MCEKGDCRGRFLCGKCHRVVIMKLRTIIWSGLFAVLVLTLILSVAGLFTGSFEMFPTAEQDEKARIAYGIVTAICTLSLIFLLYIRKKKYMH